MTAPLLPMDALFAHMFYDDTSMTHWLNAHCEYDEDDQIWLGRHYFDEGEFEYVFFEVTETPDDLFCITVRSHRGVDPFVTESVGELLAFLDHTDWHSISISTLEYWINERLDVVPNIDNNGVMWRGSFHTDFAIQQNFERDFHVGLNERHDAFLIQHRIEGLNPIRVTTVREMRHLLEEDGRLYHLIMEEFFQNNPAQHELNELRWWLNENFTPERDLPIWNGTHYYTTNGTQGEVTFEVTEIPNGFQVECTSFDNPTEPFIATSIQTLQEFMTNTNWDRLYYDDNMNYFDAMEAAYENRLRLVGPQHPEYQRYFNE